MRGGTVNAEELFPGAVLPGRFGLQSVLWGACAAACLTDEEQAKQAQDAFSFPAVKRVCVVLADGLGSLQLQSRSGHVPNLRHLDPGAQTTSVVPATTAAAITAFGTGALPGQTAMAGYSLRSPRTEAVFSLINWENSGYVAGQWQRHPTVFEQLPNAKETFAAVQPKKFIGSGLSLAALRGAACFPAQTLPERFDCAAHLLRCGKKAVYVYWGDLDSAGHRYGWKSEQWISALEYFDAEFGRFLRCVPSGTLVILTADHGMTDAGEKTDIAANADLTANVDCVAGEERAFQIYTDTPQAVARRWRERFAQDAWIVEKEELLQSGIMGSVTDFARSVIGDVLVFSKNTMGFVDSRVHSASAIAMIGVHGSMTPDEMLIPLIRVVC